MSTELRVTLGFNGELRLLYPNGKSIDLPIGEAEVRMREILVGFRKDLRSLRAEQDAAAAMRAVEAALADDFPVKRLGKPLSPNRPITMEELGL